MENALLIDVHRSWLALLDWNHWHCNTASFFEFCECLCVSGRLLSRKHFLTPTFAHGLQLFALPFGNSQTDIRTQMRSRVVCRIFGTLLRGFALPCGFDDRASLHSVLGCSHGGAHLFEARSSETSTASAFSDVVSVWTQRLELVNEFVLGIIKHLYRKKIDDDDFKCVDAVLFDCVMESCAVSSGFVTIPTSGKAVFGKALANVRLFVAKFLDVRVDDAEAIRKPAVKMLLQFRTQMLSSPLSTERLHAALKHTRAHSASVTCARAVRRWETTAHAASDFQDYVEAFSYIQDAAEDHNLHVISPTVRKGRGEGQEAWWLAQFLGACEADTTYDCDIEAIHAWDLVRCNVSPTHTRRH